MNQRFYWSPEYEIGIELIDEQHRTFFEVVNSLIDLANDTYTKEPFDLLASIGQLGSYASYHMGTEEELFQKYNYPETPEHIQAHNEFRQTVQKYIEQARNSESDPKKLTDEAARYAGNWLKNHVLVIDKKYVPFLKEHI